MKIKIMILCIAVICIITSCAVGKEKNIEQSHSQFNIETNTSIKSYEFINKAHEIEERENYISENSFTQHELNTMSLEIYQEWDNLLKEIYDYLKTIKSESKFKEIEEDEIRWIEEKENAVSIAASDFEGGTMYPMVKNTTNSEHTKRRCYYLILLID